MALNLKKIAAARSGSSEGQSGPPSNARPSAPARPAAWHGRSAPPPPSGSPWSEFLEWAEDGRLENEEDSALAMRFWRGIEPRDDGAAPSL